ncbi:Terpenoid cyclases/Protein prenyltransferases superfamily protein [Arabidopsis thaliana]|uniref:Dolabella-3,7-dien-18-ol synthase TPS06 n=1 Tax=Arabidopsis thaliana TaxID=3702 RepID=TPS06_ARATH|nr:Terpenoid cyclases/Protein prenyltransferases superfamily protein [Arabidopsis thaliana]Q84UU9.2 RecName: Full=Dolabella-3,7-dien-18-ol synthase TPS06; AltName: Full=Terpenoid synthase 6; Short=AtTPS06 [Arabidopsis thaliana]AEE35014.1 Terpenoid cyclases/Protein prenyltransferases superfamily protein [Arabidopsis thaliana]|eukprot:NP_177165.1 Terpenoid cyclases/Protein prenyltransferases superfamily protein [Arabidopsis thaliana]
MEAITKYGSYFNVRFLSRLCWRLNLSSSYHYPLLKSSLSFSRFQSPKKLCLVRATTNPTDDNSTTRSFTPHPPSLWGHHFLSASVNQTEMDDLWRQIEALKPIVNAMLLPCNGADAKKITCFIHTLVSLGVSYHFEEKIVEFLKDAFENIEDMIIDCKEDDLYTVSIIFRVFRLYGHYITPDIFNRFKGDDGNFKKCLNDDVRGMLSFYEASHFGTTTEDILEEAMSFTQKHLELFLVGEKAKHYPHITKLIQAALYIPQNFNLEILVAREYIDFYELETDHNEMLLKLAKLNFRFLQLQYIQDLKTLTTWWKELDLVSKIPVYFRERLAEPYFWATGIYYEPQYSAARIMLAKSIILVDIVDNTFDVYGTIDEVKSLVQAIERWDSDAVDVLPDYLKVVFRTTFDLFKELEEYVSSEARSFTMQYAYEQLRILMKGYLQEAEWSNRGHLPSHEEYIEVGVASTAGEVLLAMTFIPMGDAAGVGVYEWLRSRPKLTHALFVKSRLRDDIATYKEEMKRGDVCNGINCYTKQHKVSEEEACIEFEKKTNHMSKVMNEEFLKAAKFIPLHILRPVLNYGRLADVCYKYGDGYTFAGEKIKDYITSLYVDLITL